MSSSHLLVRVAVRAVGLAAVLSLAAGAAGVAAGTASAAKKPGSLPAIGNAADLSKEPIVHAGTAKPPTKLLTKDLVVGTGTTVTEDSKVSVKYVGADYTNGKDFTSSTWTSGQVATFSLSDVVAGFAEGLVGMKVGGRREIVIPPALGYQNHADGPIKADETLVFVVDLKGVTAS